jgi:hypothetical protein
MARAKQTIIVLKAHPKVKTRADAKKIAIRYADRIYTSRETSTSFRFRQKPPSKFKKGTFRTEKKTKYVSIVWGELK